MNKNAFIERFIVAFLFIILNVISSVFHYSKSNFFWCQWKEYGLLYSALSMTPEKKLYTNKYIELVLTSVSLHLTACKSANVSHVERSYTKTPGLQTTEI